MNGPSDQSAPDTSMLNMFSNAFTENPFPLFSQIRALGAVVPLPLPFEDSPNGAWMVTRLEEAVQILKDHRRFTIDAMAAETDNRLRVFGSVASGGSDKPELSARSLISVDEPDHKRLRAAVSKAFTPRYIQSLRPRIQHMADELLDAVQEQGRMDLVHDYAYPLPINVICEMLGVPTEHREQIRDVSRLLVSGSTSDTRVAQEQMFMAYVAQLIAGKRQRPGDDLISQLFQMEGEGDSLSEIETLAMIGLLIFAGHETTSNLIGIGTLMLLDHPDQLEKLKADLSLVPPAVEELLRFHGPVTMAIPRFATEDAEVSGQHIKKGDLLIISLLSVNRDETEFMQAEDLDIARQINRHIAFGQGIHTCLGAPLARLEGDIAFTTLLRRMPGLRLDAPRETIGWRPSGNLRGLTTLPVAF